MLGEGPPIPPPPPTWYGQLFAFLSTPDGIAVGVVIVAAVASLWWAASSWYDSHALAIDAGEAAAPTTYAGYKRHRKRGKR